MMTVMDVVSIWRCRDSMLGGGGGQLLAASLVAAESSVDGVYMKTLKLGKRCEESPRNGDSSRSTDKGEGEDERRRAR